MRGGCRWSPLASRSVRAAIDARWRSFNSMRLDALADGPDKARELARERDYDLVVIDVPGGEAPVLGREAQLRPPGDVTDRFRYSCLPGGDDACDPRRMAIGPGRLDERTPSVAV